MSSTEIKNLSVDRRSFLRLGFLGLLGVLFAGVGNILARYLLPQRKVERGEELSIPAAQIPLGGSLLVKYKGQPVVVIRTVEGVSAFNAICTHLGCLVKWVGRDQAFDCPCHAARFDRDGQVLSGPPPEPLHKVKVEMSGNNIVFL